MLVYEVRHDTWRLVTTDRQRAQDCLDRFGGIFVERELDYPVNNKNTTWQLERDRIQVRKEVQDD